MRRQGMSTEPHDHEDEEECFSEEPNARRDIIPSRVESFPVTDVQGHPSAEEDGGTDGNIQ